MVLFQPILYVLVSHVDDEALPYAWVIMVLKSLPNSTDYIIQA